MISSAKFFSALMELTPSDIMKIVRTTGAGDFRDALKINF